MCACEIGRSAVRARDSTEEVRGEGGTLSADGSFRRAIQTVGVNADLTLSVCGVSEIAREAGRDALRRGGKEEEAREAERTLGG